MIKKSQRTIVTGHFVECGLTDNELVSEHAESPIVTPLLWLCLRPSTTLGWDSREVIECATKDDAAETVMNTIHAVTPSMAEGEAVAVVRVLLDTMTTGSPIEIGTGIA